MEEVKAKFYAQNKMCLIKSVEEKQEESSIALPEGYKKKENPFKIGLLLNVQKNSELEEYVGSYVVFASNALEQISVQGIDVEMIPAHSIYGVIVNEQE